MKPQTGVTLIELTVVLLILMALAGVVIPYVSGTSSTALCNATDVTMQNVKKVIMERYYLDTLGRFPSDRYAADYNLKYLFIRDDGLDNNNNGRIDRVTNGGTDIDTEDAWQPFNADTQLGWRSAYLQSGLNLGTVPYLIANLGASFQDAPNHVNANLTNIDIVILDGWGRPIILQVSNCSAWGVVVTGTTLCARLISAGAGIGVGLSDTVINATIDTPINGHRNIAIGSSDDRILYLNAPTPTVDVNPSCNAN